jgi:hypothetical protein
MAKSKNQNQSGKSKDQSGKSKDQSGKSKGSRTGEPSKQNNNNENNKYRKGTVADDRPIKPKK